MDTQIQALDRSQTVSPMRQGGGVAKVVEIGSGVISELLNDS
jgi:hypothetical protein